MPKQQRMNRGKRGAKNRQNNSNQQRMVIPHPLPINGLECRHSVTLRWRATAAFTPTAITFQNILDTMIVAISAVAGYDLFQAVKIRAVRVWGIGAVGTATSVSVEFGGVTVGLVGDQAIHTDTSMGVEPAFVLAKPNSRSLAHDFQLSSANTAVILSGPAGSVIDMDLSFRGSTFGALAAGAQNALVGAVVGVQYLRGLDGFGGATNFVPEFTSGQI